jgi:hypothetical protein
MSTKEWISNYIISLTSPVIYAVLAGLARRLDLKLARRDPKLATALFYAVIIAAFGANVLIVWFAHGKKHAIAVILIAQGVTFAVLTCYILRQFLQLRKVGVIGADQQIRKGIDYATALSLCHNSL